MKYGILSNDITLFFLLQSYDNKGYGTSTGGGYASMGTAQGMGNQLGGGGMPPYGIYVAQQPVQTLPMHQVSIFFSFYFVCLFFKCHQKEGTSSRVRVACLIFIKRLKFFGRVCRIDFRTKGRKNLQLQYIVGSFLSCNFSFFLCL